MVPHFTLLLLGCCREIIVAFIYFFVLLVKVIVVEVEAFEAARVKCSILMIIENFL